MMIDGERGVVVVNGRSNSAVGEECEGKESEKEKENGDGTRNDVVR